MILASRLFFCSVEFALECSFREMVVEGDNLSVMSALELKNSLSSRVGHIIQDMLCLPNGFRWSQVQFTKRNANTITHLLARYAKQLSHDVIWDPYPMQYLGYCMVCNTSNPSHPFNLMA